MDCSLLSQLCSDSLDSKKGIMVANVRSKSDREAMYTGRMSSAAAVAAADIVVADDAGCDAGADADADAALVYEVGVGVSAGW